MPKSTPPHPPYRVQIVGDARWDYFREVVLGVRRYGFETGRLEFADRWLDHELAGDLGALVKRDGIQGIVAPLHDPRTERRFAALSVPVVNVSNGPVASRVPLVTQDDAAVGRLAAAHLQACGCRAFGFWGIPGAAFSDQRQAGFADALREAGFSPLIGNPAGGAARWSRRMKTWLAALPRPAGVFGASDTHALAVIRAARELGLRVPEDVAVLGAGNEDFWVEFEKTPLTSIKLPARAIGREAAALLDRLITRRERRAPAVRLPVVEIAARRSTDIIFDEDKVVARALRFIRDHAHENPYVEDVAKAAGVSKAVLKTRFRKVAGRPVLAEILRVRITRAQSLLAATTAPMSLIAERCGFPNSQRFSARFRQLTGHTPSAYRRRLQSKGTHP